MSFFIDKPDDGVRKGPSTVRWEIRCALIGCYGSDVNERLYTPEQVQFYSASQFDWTVP